MRRQQKHDRVGKLVAEVETAARRLRADVRKRADNVGILRQLQSAADQLRKRAAVAAGQVEKYVHEIRKSLEGAPKKVSKRKKPKAAKKATASSVSMPI